MALSQAQQQVLNQYNIPQDLIDWVAQEFDAHGSPKAKEAPDFLMVLSDLLQASETYLDVQHKKLIQLQKKDHSGDVSAQEWQVLVNSLEEVVKEAWLRSTAFWRIIDEVLKAPQNYQIVIDRRHLKYAFQKKNLPLVEMLKWAKPAFFEFPEPAPVVKWLSGIIGCIGGAVAGLWAGIVSSLPNPKRSLLVQPFLMMSAALTGLISGPVQGARTAGSIGYRTGNPHLAIGLGYQAALFNPFKEPVGSKNQQTVELKIQQAFFTLSEAVSEKT